MRERLSSAPSPTVGTVSVESVAIEREISLSLIERPATETERQIVIVREEEEEEERRRRRREGSVAHLALEEDGSSW